MKRCSPNRGYVAIADRLEMLQAIDSRRPWKSLDDERVCVLCERRFAGRQVDFEQFAKGRVEVRCPTIGCAATPHEWVYLNDPRVAPRDGRQRPDFFGFPVEAQTT